VGLIASLANVTGANVSEGDAGAVVAFRPIAGAADL